jgi:4-hydroxy-tetrahydrodipicolinate synthase
MSADLTGIIPPIVTPFTADGEVDEQAFRGVVRFMVKKKVHGICVGGSSGEGHTYSAEEFKRLNEIAVEEVKGAIPVIAGIIVNSTRDAIARARSIAHLPMAGLQVTPVHYVFKPDEDATYKHFKALTESTKFPVIIYNVVPWNYLSPALLVRIMKDMPGVIGVKQSAGDLKLMADLLINLPAGKKVYSAVDALLYPSFALGAHGAIAANPAAVPGVCVNLWNAVQAGDHVKAKQIHESLLRFWNSISADNLPANIKHALSLQGCATGLPRMPMPATTEQQAANIRRELDQVLQFDN